MANDHGELPFGGFLQPNRPNIPLQAGKPHYAKALDQAGSGVAGGRGDLDDVVLALWQGHII